MVAGVGGRRCVDTGKVTRTGRRWGVTTLMAGAGLFRVAMPRRRMSAMGVASLGFVDNLLVALFR